MIDTTKIRGAADWVGDPERGLALLEQVGAGSHDTPDVVIDLVAVMAARITELQAELDEISLTDRDTQNDYIEQLQGDVSSANDCIAALEAELAICQAESDSDPRISEVESLLHPMYAVVELYGDGEPIIEYDRDYRKAVPMAELMASLRELAKSTKAASTPKVSVWLTQAEWAAVQEKRKAGE